MRMRELSERLGIPITTFQKWVKKDPSLSILKAGGPGGSSHWIKLDKLAGRHGITLADAYMLGSSRWMKAVVLADMAGISRKTVANWCRFRPGFAKRLGRVYYIDLEQFGATPEDIDQVTRAIRGPQ